MYWFSDHAQPGVVLKMNTKQVQSEMILLHPSDYGKLRNAAVRESLRMKEAGVIGIVADAEVEKIDSAYFAYCEAKRVEQDGTPQEQDKGSKQVTV